MDMVVSFLPLPLAIKQSVSINLN